MIIASHSLMKHSDLESVHNASTLIDMGWYMGRLLILHFELGTQLPINLPKLNCHREQGITGYWGLSVIAKLSGGSFLKS